MLSFMQGGNFFTAAASAFLASTVSFGYGQAVEGAYSVRTGDTWNAFRGGSALSGVNFWDGKRLVELWPN